MDERCRMTAVELGRAIQKRKIGIEKLTRFYLDRIEKVDHALNTVQSPEHWIPRGR